MFVVIVAVLAFTVAVAWNALAAWGIRLCSEGRAWRAAWVDLALGVLGLASLWGVVEVGWWVAPIELAGGFVGTLIGTRAAARV